MRLLVKFIFWVSIANSLRGYFRKDDIKINPIKIKIFPRNIIINSRGNFYIFRDDFNIILLEK